MRPRCVAVVLLRHDGNKVEAAKGLGVSRRTPDRLTEKYRLTGSSVEAERTPRQE